jgi:hypothetical protein
MESFFHTLKTELVHHQQYATRDEASRDIFAYIEGFYNRTRRHSAIGYLSPIEMELKASALHLRSMEGIELPAMFALLLGADLAGSPEGECDRLLQCWLPFDLAADVADDPASRVP